MSIQLLFADGFDVYNSLVLNWTTPGTDTNITLDAGVQRSGRGCMKILSSAFGPSLVFANQSNILAAGAFNPGGVVPSNSGEIFRWSEGVSGLRIVMFYLPDLSLAFDIDNGAFFGQTMAGIINVNSYNFIAMRMQCGVSGSIRVWVNGVQVVNIGSVNLQPAGKAAFVNTIELMCFGGTTTGLWDDFSLWTWSDPNADNFAYAPSVIPALPLTDSTPLNWTPSTGTNHSALVNAVPQQSTTYVSDATPTDIDQYIHAIPVNQQIPPLPGSPAILGVYHMLLAEIDAAGVRTIASNKAGAAGPTNFALTTSYLYYGQPYTPGLASYAALATTPFGPEVTA